MENEFKRDYPERPVVAVGVIVWNGPRVLLVRRGKPPRDGEWSIPGGAQHVGEPVADTALREVMEETGIAIRITGIVDVVDYIDRDDDGRIRHHYTLVDLMAEATSESPVPGDDVVEARWVNPNELGQFELWDETVRVIDHAAALRHGKKAP